MTNRIDITHYLVSDRRIAFLRLSGYRFRMYGERVYAVREVGMSTVTRGRATDG